MPVHLRIKYIEDRLKVKQNDSENESNGDEHQKFHAPFQRGNQDPSGSRRPYTRIKKDGSLPPTSPASIPSRLPSYRLKKHKKHITISNMETLRKRKPIADQIFDDEDDDHESSSQGDVHS
jgi:hypothetical protein